MTKAQKYLEALKTFDDWVIVSEWAVRVGELYPDILEAANEQAANQANETIGLRELEIKGTEIKGQKYKNKENKGIKGTNKWGQSPP